MTRSARFNSIIVLTFVCVANGANILFLTGLPSPSHHIWNREITNGLSARGYNLTVLSIDVDPVQLSNVHYLQLNDIYEKFHVDYVKTLFETNKKSNPFNGPIEYHDFVSTICERTYQRIHHFQHQFLLKFSFADRFTVLVETSGFAQLQAYPDDFRFDLVIYDFTCGPCLLPFLHKFNNPPLVAVSAYNIPPYTSETVGGHQYYAYVPHNSLSNAGQELHIVDRAVNMLIYTVENL